MTLAHNFFLFLTELVIDFKTFHMQTEQYCMKQRSNNEILGSMATWHFRLVQACHRTIMLKVIILVTATLGFFNSITDATRIPESRPWAHAKLKSNINCH